MESDIWRLIFGHSFGESWSVRPVASGRLKWYFVFAFHKVIRYLIFPFQPHQKDRLFRQPSAWSESIIGLDFQVYTFAC